MGALVRFVVCVIVLPDPDPGPQSGWQGHHRGDHGRGFREQEFNASCRSPLLYPHPTTGEALSLTRSRLPNLSPAVVRGSVELAAAHQPGSLAEGWRGVSCCLVAVWALRSNPFCSPPCVWQTGHSACVIYTSHFLIRRSPWLWVQTVTCLLAGAQDMFTLSN